jgi:hypothetical protein
MSSLIQALQEWGSKDENHQIQTSEGDDNISVWFGEGDVDIPAVYLSLHKGILPEGGIPLASKYFPDATGVTPMVRHPIAEYRLEVLLVELAKIYPDLWTRNDWYVERR